MPPIPRINFTGLCYQDKDRLIFRHVRTPDRGRGKAGLEQRELEQAAIVEWTGQEAEDCGPTSCTPKRYCPSLQIYRPVLEQYRRTGRAHA